MVEISHTEQLALRFRRIDNRTQQVEASGELQSLADRTYKLHCLGKELGMQINDTTFVDATVEFVDVVSKFHTVIGDDIRCSTGTCSCIVAMLGHLISGTRNNEARSGGYIECVLAVATSAHHVDISVAVERHRYSCLKDTIAESEQFVNRNSPHLQGSQQCGDLLIGKFTFCYTNKNILGLFPCQFLMI